MPSPVSFVFTGFQGVDTSSGIESLGASPNSPGRYNLATIENGRITRDGGVFVRNGIEQVQSLSTNAKVDSIEGMENDKLQVVFTKSGTQILQSKDPETTAFTDIGVTRTAGESDFFFHKRKDVYAINQTDDPLQIVVSTVASVDTGASTLTLRTGDGAEFASSGTVYVLGISVTYSGVSTDTLTGCSGLTAAMAAGDIVTQTVVQSSIPKGTTMGELDGSALVGGVSADATALYFSEPSSTANPELFYSFPTTYVTPLPRDITAIKSGSTSTLIGMRKGLQFTNGFNILIGVPETHSASTVHSIPNAHCMEQTDEDFAILTQEGRILPAGQTDAGFQVVENPLNTIEDMDYPIQGFIQKNADKSDGSSNFIHYDPSSRTVSNSILMNTGINQELVYQRDIGAWSVDTAKNIACKTVFKGKTYAGSDNDDKIYLDNSGRTDDQIPINFRMVTGQMMLDEKRIKFDILNLVVGGLLSALGQFTIRVICDGSNAFSQDITADQLVDMDLMDLTTGVPIGYGGIGGEEIGSGGDAVEGFAFTCPIELSIECSFFQVEIQTLDEGTALEVRELRVDCETEGESIFNTF